MRKEGGPAGGRVTAAARGPTLCSNGECKCVVNACVLYRPVHMDTRVDSVRRVICGRWGCSPQQVVGGKGCRNVVDRQLARRAEFWRRRPNQSSKRALAHEDF